MEIQDDRTDTQKLTHRWLVIGTDRFLSGWGKCEGGASYAAWACEPKYRRHVLDWVSSRTDMTRVREAADADTYRPKGRGHLHIYVVDDDHPALPGWLKRELAAAATERTDTERESP